MTRIYATSEKFVSYNSPLYAAMLRSLLAIYGASAPFILKGELTNRPACDDLLLCLQAHSEQEVSAISTKRSGCLRFGSAMTPTTETRMKAEHILAESIIVGDFRRNGLLDSHPSSDRRHRAEPYESSLARQEHTGVCSLSHCYDSIRVFLNSLYHPRSFQNACSSFLQTASCPINAKKSSLSSCGTIGSSGIEKGSITLLSASIIKASTIGSVP